ncbi:MAG: M6 family metalloprotease domain-containing protein [Planctomycetota bacterium]
MPCKLRVSLFVVMALFCLWPGWLWAAPFAEKIPFTQPDGTQIELWGEGDEFYAVFETLDGYTVVFDPATRAYHYAILSPDGNELVASGTLIGKGNPAILVMAKHLRIKPEARKKQSAERRNQWEQATGTSARWQQLKAARRQAELAAGVSHRAPPSSTTTGTKIGITLLIDFPDNPSTISQADIDNFCNGDSYTGYGNNGSIKKYFQDNSNGQLNYTNVVTAYIRMAQPKSYYNNTSVDIGVCARLLITDALTIMKNLSNYNTDILLAFNNITVNANNQVVAFNVFFAGANSGTNVGGLWPHSWELAYPGVELSAGGKVIRYYQITNIGNSLAIGTFCHENGHLLCGFPDIYDYGDDSVGGAGMFCLMACGASTPSTRTNPTQICAYLKQAAGWSTVVDLTSASNGLATLSAAPMTGYNNFYRFRKPGVTTEYFLAENRQRNGRDASLPASGIAIWHIDELGDRDNQSMVPNTNHANYEVTLVQADNLWHLQTTTNNFGDAYDLYYSGNSATAYTNQFTDTSSPNAHWWDGTDSGVNFRNFSSSGATMTFGATSSVSVSFTTASQSLTESSGGTMTITAQLSAPSTSAVTVPFTVSGTATQGADYTITASPITISAGSTTGNITITLINDTIWEHNEKIIVTMGTPTCASINVFRGATPVHTATIIDNDSESALETWSVTTLAGTAGQSGSTNGTGSAARFNYLSGMAVDGAGYVYVGDYYNHTIRKISPSGDVTTLAGAVGQTGNTNGTGSAARFNQPDGVAVDSAGNVYVADNLNYTIRKITPGGAVSTFAGTTGVSGNDDGSLGIGKFSEPWGVAVGTDNYVYVGDWGNHTVRKVTPSGVITTLAGSAGQRGSANGTGSAARFQRPVGVAVDAADNVYVADSGNYTIRKITSVGVVTTLAGSPGEIGCANGMGSVARFNAAEGVAVDAAGNNVYVVDTQNFTLRQITPSGVVTTLAGLVNADRLETGDSRDGIGSAARFSQPYGVAVDSNGRVYVGDFDKQTVRKCSPPVVNTPPVLTSGPTAIPNPVNVGQTVTCAAVATDADGDTLTYNWTFGDSTTGVGSSVTHAYTAAGTYTVTVTVNDGRGGTTSDSVQVTVNAAPPPPPPSIAPVITSALTANGVVGTVFSYTITATGTATITFNATNLPAGLIISGDVISGAPTIAGVATITLTATNAAGMDTKILTLTIHKATGVNNPPAFTAPPTASPNPATVGQEVIFTANASDPDGDLLGYTWEFGDGAYEAGNSVTHTYARTGLYKVQVVVSDGIASVSRELNLGVNDADGPGGDPKDFIISKALIKLNFLKSKPNSDMLVFSGTVPIPQNFTPKDKTVVIAIGDYESTFTLDAKGKAISGTDSLKLSGKFKRQLTGKLKENVYISSPLKFIYTVKKQNLFDKLENYGFVNDDIVKPGNSIDLPVIITVDGDSYFDTLTVIYTAKKNKNGSAKK